MAYTCPYPSAASPSFPISSTEMDSGQNPIYHLTAISSHFGEHSGILDFQRLVSAQCQCPVVPEAMRICLPQAQLPSLWLPGPLGEIYCLYLWPSCRVLSHQHNVASLSIKRVWVWEVGERFDAPLQEVQISVHLSVFVYQVVH